MLDQRPLKSDECPLLRMWLAMISRRNEVRVAGVLRRRPPLHITNHQHKLKGCPCTAAMHHRMPLSCHRDRSCPREIETMLLHRSSIIRHHLLHHRRVTLAPMVTTKCLVNKNKRSNKLPHPRIFLARTMAMGTAKRRPQPRVSLIGHLRELELAIFRCSNGAKPVGTGHHLRTMMTTVMATVAPLTTHVVLDALTGPPPL